MISMAPLPLPKDDNFSLLKPDLNCLARAVISVARDPRIWFLIGG